MDTRSAGKQEIGKCHVASVCASIEGIAEKLVRADYEEWITDAE